MVALMHCGSRPPDPGPFTTKPAHRQNGHHLVIQQNGTAKRPSSEQPIQWRKVLYDRQGVPDNYVPPTFLKDLKKNGKETARLVGC